MHISLRVWDFSVTAVEYAKSSTYKCVSSYRKSFFPPNDFTMAHIELLHLSVIHSAANLIPFSLPAF